MFSKICVIDKLRVSVDTRDVTSKSKVTCLSCDSESPQRTEEEQVCWSNGTTVLNVTRIKDNEIRNQRGDYFCDTELMLFTPFLFDLINNHCVTRSHLENVLNLTKKDMEVPEKVMRIKECKHIVKSPNVPKKNKQKLRSKENGESSHFTPLVPKSFVQ